MIEFTIDTSALLKLANAIPELEAAINDEIERAVQDSGKLIASVASANTPINNGTLASAISGGFEMQGSVLDVLRGIVGADSSIEYEGTAASTYVNYVEQGTRPHWPPIKPLKLWALRKLLDERIGYAVQWKIARSGTQGAHMFQRAWDGVGKAYLEGKVEQIPVKAIARFEKAAK